jgi:hypothetical protein
MRANDELKKYSTQFVPRNSANLRGFDAAQFENKMFNVCSQYCKLAYQITIRDFAILRTVSFNQIRQHNLMSSLTRVA